MKPISHSPTASASKSMGTSDDLLPDTLRDPGPPWRGVEDQPRPLGTHGLRSPCRPLVRPVRPAPLTSDWSLCGGCLAGDSCRPPSPCVECRSLTTLLGKDPGNCLTGPIRLCYPASPAGNRFLRPTKRCHVIRTTGPRPRGAVRIGPSDAPGRRGRWDGPREVPARFVAGESAPLETRSDQKPIAVRWRASSVATAQR